MHKKQIIYRFMEIINPKNFLYNFDCFCNLYVYPKFPYLKYIKDKNKGKPSIYKLYNFYRGETVSKFWITRFIEHNNLNEKGKKIDFFSVFGPRDVIKFSKNTKIFYTGEPVASDMYYEYDDYFLNDSDLSIGFREYKGLNNYYRLPLWLTYNLFLPEKTSLKEIRNVIQELENKKNHDNIRNGFCALIARHDDMTKMRGKTYHRLLTLGKISCPGRFLHNDDTAIPLYSDKINYLKNFKFNICPENHLNHGYVTEKLIDSIKAGCIPIYNGIFGELEEKIFNKNRIVFINDKLEENIKLLNNSKKYYMKFIEQPIFNKNADIYIYNLFEDFKIKLKNTLKS